MNREAIITLIQTRRTQNALGEELIAEVERREVFATLHSITLQEFTRAGQEGLRPQVMARVHAFEYQNETAVELDGTPLHVYRTYLPKGEHIELYLEGGATDGIF